MGEHLDLLLGDPMRRLRLDRGPAEPAHALHLAALDREVDLRRALVAAHDFELVAEHVIHQQREIDHGGAGRGGADDYFLGGELGDARNRHRVPHEGDVGLAVGAAEPDQLRGVELRARHQERRGRDAVDRDADDGAVLGPLREELVGHHHAAGGRLVLHDDNWIAGDMIADVARDNAREQVVAAACGRADHKAQLLAFVEGADIFLSRRGRARAEQNRTEGRE